MGRLRLPLLFFLRGYTSRELRKRRGLLGLSLSMAIGVSDGTKCSRGFFSVVKGDFVGFETGLYYR
jgi:hypothetical protein